MQFFSHGVNDGIWTGLLEADHPPTRLCLTRHGEVLAEAELSSDGDRQWRVRVVLPGQVISDGVQSLLLVADESASGAPVSASSRHLARLPLLAGSPLDNSIEAEIALLRDELELLKREFRHFAAGD